MKASERDVAKVNNMALTLAEYIIDYGMEGYLPNGGCFIPKGSKEEEDVLYIALLISKRLERAA